MGKIIGICNQKGGTGKTTTSINFSSYLGLANKKTLLIDMDPQGNSTSGIGFNHEGKYSIYDVLVGDVNVSECIYGTEWPNLQIMPAQVSLTGGEIELVNKDNREGKLKEILNQIKDDFEYIIIDAPPSLGLLTLNVLVASDSLIIPVQCEYFALEGVSKIINTIELVKERLNFSLEIEGILLVMADFRTRLSLQVIEEVRNYFPKETFNVIVPRNIKLAEAPSFGKPIHSYDSICVGAKAYKNLTEAFLKEKIEIKEVIKERSM